MDLRNRRRLQALLIAALFAVPVILALLLGFLGWAPTANSYGQPIQPERDLTAVPVQRADGEAFKWSNNDAVWTLVALPGPDCAERCLRKLDLTHRAQIALGRHAGKLRLLYLGTPPDGPAARGFGKVWMLATTTSQVLDHWRTTARNSVSAVLVTPDGKALTRYPAPINPSRLGKDLGKLVH